MGSSEHDGATREEEEEEGPLGEFVLTRKWGGRYDDDRRAPEARPTPTQALCNAAAAPLAASNEKAEAACSAASPSMSGNLAHSASSEGPLPPLAAASSLSAESSLPPSSSLPSSTAVSTARGAVSSIDGADRDDTLSPSLIPFLSQPASSPQPPSLNVLWHLLSSWQSCAALAVSAVAAAAGLAAACRGDPDCSRLSWWWHRQLVWLQWPPSPWQKQVCWLVSGVLWLLLAWRLKLTRRVRAWLQPVVTRQVVAGTPVLLAIQRWRHPVLDTVMESLALTVSVEFYTAFLPLLYWSGREEQTLLLAMLMALCVYSGNSLKDVVCAPRPPSPPVVRVVRSSMESQNSREYGLPSTHTMITLAMLLYTLGSEWSYFQAQPSAAAVAIATGTMFSFFVIIGRLYLGMHSVVDVVVGIALGALLPCLWLAADNSVLHFLTHGPNVELFLGGLSVVVLLGYPVPEDPTPSFEDHTAFTGVIFGLSSAFHRRQLLHPARVQSAVSAAAAALSTATPLPLNSLSGWAALGLRGAVGLPLILLVKTVVKAAAQPAVRSVALLAERLAAQCTSKQTPLSAQPPKQDCPASLSVHDQQAVSLDHLVAEVIKLPEALDCTAADGDCSSCSCSSSSISSSRNRTSRSSSSSSINSSSSDSSSNTSIITSCSSSHIAEGDEMTRSTSYSEKRTSSVSLQWNGVDPLNSLWAVVPAGGLLHGMQVACSACGSATKAQSSGEEPGPHGPSEDRACAFAPVTDTVVRFVVYACLGWSVAHTSPHVFNVMAI